MSYDRIYSMLIARDREMRILAMITLVKLGRQLCVAFFEKYGRDSISLPEDLKSLSLKSIEYGDDRDNWTIPAVLVRNNNVCIAACGVAWVCSDTPSLWVMDNSLIIDI